MILQPPFSPPVPFDDAAAALAQARRIYDAGCAHLRAALADYIGAPAASPSAPPAALAGMPQAWQKRENALLRAWQ